SDINTLKKRLRKIAQVEVYDAFAPYGSAYRHRFGIENEQAMDLFHQTISMKSVGNLTDFVREHMLEASAVEERIQALIGHYQDLDPIRQAIAEHGGDRIESIKREIGDKQAQKEERARRAGQYDMRAKALGLPGATDAESFLANQRAIRDGRQQSEAAQAEAQNALTETGVEL